MECVAAERALAARDQGCYATRKKAERELKRKQRDANKVTDENHETKGRQVNEHNQTNICRGIVWAAECGCNLMYTSVSGVGRVHIQTTLYIKNVKEYRGG